MPLSRRHLLLSASAAFARGIKLKVGVTDWNLRLAANPEAVALASRIGFDGLQISLGREPVNDKLKLADVALQAQYLAAAKERRITLNGTCLDILHRNYLKNDPLGPRWVADSVGITKAMGMKVILLPFFGKGAIKERAEQERVADILKEQVAAAEKAGVVFGLEDTISAADNARMLDRIGSKAVQVYYDCGNSFKEGYDVDREVDFLGKKRICQVHIKDNPHYLGEGQIDIKRFVATLAKVGYSDWANLETDAPSRNVEADMKRNLTYVQRVLG